MTRLEKTRLVCLPIMVLSILTGGLLHDLTEMTFTANGIWIIAVVSGLACVDWENLS